MPLQRLEIEHRRRSDHEPGHDARAEVVIRDARDAGLAHRRMLQQHRLDLGRVHVLAARDDQVVASVEHLQAAVGVEAADVAGVQPAALERARRRLGIVQVALHHGRSAHQDLARRAGRRVAAVVDDPQLRALHGRIGRGVRRAGRAAARAVATCERGLGEAVGGAHRDSRRRARAPAVPARPPRRRAAARAARAAPGAHRGARAAATAWWARATRRRCRRRRARC